MIHLTRSLIRRWLDVLLHIQDTPVRTAAAFALGVFFGFSPFLGLHTLLGLLFAFLLNLNRVSVMLGVYSNLPWFLGPYYVGTTMVGAKIMGHRVPRDFGIQLQQLFELSLFQGEFWRELWLIVLKPLGWSYFVGSTLGAIILAGVAYRLALAFIASRRRIQNLLHHHKP